MNRHNIVLGFLSDPLENVFKWTEAAPNRFIASPAVFEPGKADLAMLRREYKASRLGGMGELAAQYAGIAPNDPRLEPLFALAEEFDVPVLIHTEGIAGTSERFRIAHGHPELLEEVLARRPRLRLYVENAGFPFVNETIALMYRYENVYVDVSTITWIIPRPTFYRVLSELFDAGLGTRVMFGSDQMNWPDTIDAAVEAIASAPMLTAEQKRDVFYNNAARFLRLHEKKKSN
jgi:predicted TIM-barrel fold metal-dependent hydrolase